MNAQWAYGGAGTGAPVHYHNTAWNALVYGAKYWVMYPPHTLVMSNKQILKFIEDGINQNIYVYNTTIVILYIL